MSLGEALLEDLPQNMRRVPLLQRMPCPAALAGRLVGAAQGAWPVYGKYLGLVLVLVVLFSSNVNLLAPEAFVRLFVVFLAGLLGFHWGGYPYLSVLMYVFFLAYMLALGLRLTRTAVEESGPTFMGGFACYIKDPCTQEPKLEPILDCPESLRWSNMWQDMMRNRWHYFLKCAGSLGLMRLVKHCEQEALSTRDQSGRDIYSNKGAR